ncbi:MAG: phosphate ABC transporter permease PstA [Nevskiales bacterium]|nr:phosphate ABC transporter permease PstA [Nevskiales bacterium]
MDLPPQLSVASRDLSGQNLRDMRAYVRSGTPYVWVTAAAIATSVIIVVSLLFLIAARGLPFFWPADVVVGEYREPGKEPVRLMAELVESETYTTARLQSAGLAVDSRQHFYDRLLLKVGNRDLYGADFRYLLDDWLVERRYPENALVLERMEWGNFYGEMIAVRQDGAITASGDEAYAAWRPLQQRANDLRQQIRSIEKDEIGAINYGLEQLRLKSRRLELDHKTPASHPEDYAELERRGQALEGQYGDLQKRLEGLYSDIRRDSVLVRTVDGQELEIPLSKIVRGYRPNAMHVVDKLGYYLTKLWEFGAGDPREANTEGGIFPAIFGTVLMVLIMSAIVTPFGVVAAVYLREYARQGTLTRIIRIAVNNLAGVPSIVFGMFGLGFFVYFVGGNIDKLFYPEAAPAPVFGTPGILWASLTLALLTLPVVIVATEEGLARIPRSLREASLSLGATKAETLWRVVLPMASPAMMTGLILAIARAAGEVAPLMLVGVVKLAPSLPLDLNLPFLHLDRKFMHLGFHIYDVGFQSPNVEAARPLVYATALLLVGVIVILNLAAIRIRNRLRERYRALDQ